MIFSRLSLNKNPKHSKQSNFNNYIALHTYTYIYYVYILLVTYLFIKIYTIFVHKWRYRDRGSFRAIDLYIKWMVGVWSHKYLLT